MNDLEPNARSLGKPTPPRGSDRTGWRSSRRGYVIVILIFLAIGVVLAMGLERNPRLIPSPLIGKPVPEFDLPPVKGRELGLASEDLRGEVSLVNVFASWCAACRDEHPLWMELSRKGVVPIHGLNYKDEPDDAAQWLDTLGDPYTRTGADTSGRVGIEWGVYGVPETFVIDHEGRIAYKHIGPVDRRVLTHTLLPLIERLQTNDVDPEGHFRSSERPLDGEVHVPGTALHQAQIHLVPRLPISRTDGHHLDGPPAVNGPRPTALLRARLSTCSAEERPRNWWKDTTAAVPPDR